MLDGEDLEEDAVNISLGAAAEEEVDWGCSDDDENDEEEDVEEAESRWAPWIPTQNPPSNVKGRRTRRTFWRTGWEALHTTADSLQVVAGRENGHLYFCAKPLEKSASESWLLTNAGSLANAYCRMPLLLSTLYTGIFKAVVEPEQLNIVEVDPRDGMHGRNVNGLRGEASLDRSSGSSEGGVQAISISWPRPDRTERLHCLGEVQHEALEKQRSGTSTNLGSIPTDLCD
eukprot:s214_g30.t1